MQCSCAFGRDFTSVLRKAQSEDSVLIFCVDIFLGNVLRLHRSSGSLPRRIAHLRMYLPSLSFSSLSRPLAGGNGQITVFQLCCDLIFLEARQINIYFIAVFSLTDICLHHVLCVFSIQRILLSKEISISNGKSIQFIK